MKRDTQALEDFLKMLPEDASHVFEFRHNSWFDDGVFDLLHRYNVGFCIYDMLGFSMPLIATPDFAYIRFHGGRWLYGCCWRSGLARLQNLRVSVVYAYFNNDAEGFATRSVSE